MKMRNRIKKHSLKLISIFLSIFLWVYVLNSEKVKFEKTVQLEYILPEEMMLAQKPVSEVTFLIEGPRAFVRTVAEREDRLIIDLNRANAKRQLNFQVDINPTQLSLPFGMVVEKVLPRKIAIRMEKKASRIVPLRLQTQGFLPNDLHLTNIELSPAEVEVYGPRSVISLLKEVPTKTIELESLLGLDEIPLEIQLPDDRLTVTSGTNIRMSYQLKATSSNLSFMAPIKFMSLKGKVTSETKAAKLKLYVPEKIIKNRSNVSSTIQVWADIPSNAWGRIEVPLRVVLPPSIHLLEISPKTIIVNIQ